MLGLSLRWGEAIDMYRNVMPMHGDAKLAGDTAFRSCTDADGRRSRKRGRPGSRGRSSGRGK